MKYTLYDEEVNPGVAFDQDAFYLKIPILKIFDNCECEIVDTEYHELTKMDIINNFTGLLITASEDTDFLEVVYFEEDCYAYEWEDEIKEVTYSLFIIPKEQKMELSISFAQNIGVYEYPLYSAEYQANTDTAKIYNQLIEDSHTFFHEDLMKIVQIYKEFII